MTIWHSRRPAAGIALGFAAVLVGLSLAVILLGKPVALLFVGLLGVGQAALVLSMLRPSSLSFDGADVVIRAGGSQKRAARSDIASCAQVGQQWIFSDATGAQLLSLPVYGFNQADVVAFCKQAGLNLKTPASTVDQRRKEITSAKITRAMGVVLAVPLLILAGWTIQTSLSAQDALSRYRAAPVCAAGARASSNCRLQAQGRVTSTEAHRSSTDLHVTLTASGGDYLAVIRNADFAPKTGDLVFVEVWSGKVTRLGEKDTLGNPEVNPNLDVKGVVAVIALFAAIPMGMAVVGHVQLRFARARLRRAAAAESGSAGPVEAVHPGTVVQAGGLPPCGINHHPKEVFFAHWDPKAEKTGIIIAFVIALVVLAILGVLAYYVSIPIFGGIAALGLAWFGLNLFGEWRERRSGGVFADDLHIGKLTTSNGRWVRKVYQRSSVLECNIAAGPTLSVVGVDGSTLFWTSAITSGDMDRFVTFLGCKVTREAPAAQPDAIASPPVKTPLGVLPLRVRRAAGLMQAIGGLMLGLSVINIPRMLGLSADLQVHGLELLASFAVYGAAMLWLGSRLAKGRSRSREMALIGGGIATTLLPVISFVIYINLAVSAIFAAIMLPVYALVYYWLREPVPGSAAQAKEPGQT